MRHPVRWLRGHMARLRGIQEVVPNTLYIGSLKAAQSEGAAFERVVSIGDNAVANATLHLELQDHEQVPWDELNRFASFTWEDDEPLLIHCQVGRSRSAAFATFWLMLHLDTTWEDAHALVRKACPSAKVAPELRSSIRAWAGEEEYELA